MGGWSEDGVVAEVSMATREQGLGGENLRAGGGSRWMETTDDCVAWLSLIRLPAGLKRGCCSFHPRLGNG